MPIVWFAIVAAFIAVVLTIFRERSLRRWSLGEPREEAMEFASYSAKPHPLSANSFLLWISLTLIIISVALFFLIDRAVPCVVILITGILSYFLYDLAGSSVRTNIAVMPDGLYFEAAKGDKRPFFIPFSDVKKIEETTTGFYIELKPLKFANRLPLKCRKTEEIIAKIEGIWRAGARVERSL
ncbi:hypothetical protein DRQ36_00930 [bacterium]|nr:MAG: hypothetical protein DRQ36_00930 [bacterium]